MGLLVSVYRKSGHGPFAGDCTNGGISAQADQLCLVNVDGPFEPSERAPAAMLMAHRPFGDRAPMVRIVPAVRNQHDRFHEPEKRWTMFGGNYAGSSDSRFAEKLAELLGHGSFYGAVPIHDRIEEAA